MGYWTDSSTLLRECHKMHESIEWVILSNTLFFAFHMSYVSKKLNDCIFNQLMDLEKVSKVNKLEHIGSVIKDGPGDDLLFLKIDQFSEKCCSDARL